MNLFLDTETSGLPIGKRDSDIGQPGIMQVAWIKHDGDGIHDEFCTLVKPPPKRMPPKLSPQAFGVHGLDWSTCAQEGMDLREAMKLFYEACDGIEQLCGFAVHFDARMMRIGHRQASFDPKWINALAKRCIMNEAREILNLCPTDKMAGSGRLANKCPNLVEAFEHLCGPVTWKAHNALEDCRATIAVADAIDARRATLDLKQPKPTTDSQRAPRAKSSRPAKTKTAKHSVGNLFGGRKGRKMNI